MPERRGTKGLVPGEVAEHKASATGVLPDDRVALDATLRPVNEKQS